MTKRIWATHVIVVVHVVLLDQLLGRLYFVQRDALRGTTCLTDAFGVRLALRFAFLISRWRHERSAQTTTKPC